MQFSNTSFRNIAFGILGLLLIVIMTSTFRIKNSIVNSVFGVKNINAYSNTQEYSNWNTDNREGFTVREGFIFDTEKKNEDNVDECINRKLSSLKTELGGDKGINDIKNILKNAKKICDYEATKSMMNLLSANKSTKTINLEDILNDHENKDCGRCKDYTELSSKLKDMLDNI
tara:strand:+ start:18099 stop:18617 length:519 start_codon:yes stop_codon:yes gene_type:complete